MINCESCALFKQCKKKPMKKNEACSVKTIQAITINTEEETALQLG